MEKSWGEYGLSKQWTPTVMPCEVRLYSIIIQYRLLEIFLPIDVFFSFYSKYYGKVILI